MTGISLEIRTIDLIERMMAAGWKLKEFTGHGAVTGKRQVQTLTWEREEPKP